MRAAAVQLAETVGLVSACRAVGVSRASVYRDRRPPASFAWRPRRSPPRALAPQERDQVINTLHEERFADRAPAAVYATLLEERQYLCSIRTMYRLLEAVEEVTERRTQLHHPHREPPRLVATAPNQVWSWDITRLPGPCKWMFFALYVVLDLFSRYVVAWMVASRESAALAKRLMQGACRNQGIEPGQLTLHQDRGAPMTAKPFSQLLMDLDILASFSRPRVPDDNPFSESHFKTVKYAPDYPGSFKDLEEARTYFQVFLPRYNAEHRHSGLGLLTPAAVHYGRAAGIQVARQQVLDQAYLTNPERFVNHPPTAPKIPTEVWINQPAATIHTESLLH